MNELEEFGFNRSFYHKNILTLKAKKKADLSHFDKRDLQYEYIIKSHEWIESEKCNAIDTEIIINYCDMPIAKIEILLMGRAFSETQQTYFMDDVKNYFKVNYKRQIEQWITNEINEIILFG